MSLKKGQKELRASSSQAKRGWFVVAAAVSRSHVRRSHCEGL